jgi:hypothetical protein
MKSIAAAGLVLLTLVANGFSANADYKSVLVTVTNDSVRVRLPLTDVTGKVRVKERTADGFGLPLAPMKTALGKKHYLEWQIGYDTPGTNSPTLVPQIIFTRNGETKHGHELSKIIFESVRLGLLTTNQIIAELAALKKIPATDFEESQPMQVETDTNNASGGFQRAVQRIPQFTKTTPHGSVQIQLKQKQRAVGYQAMVYVCLPLNQVLTADGAPRKSSPAKSKETVYYDFTRVNAVFILDICHAFGMASQQHNEDISKILNLVLKHAND